MTIQEAIMKAIEGGWKPNHLAQVMKFPTGAAVISENAFTDPLFWQSLGKAMGWGILHCENCGKKAVAVRKKKSAPEYWANCCERKLLSYGSSSIAHWHRFIDHLANGKTAESYFQTMC